MTVNKIEDWLGKPLFMVPLRLGTKTPVVKYTQETIESTQTEVYRAMLEVNNVAVRLGEYSGGFCAIDFDDDQSLEQFLQVNPHLESSARWKGCRGAQIGVRITGAYPGPSSARHPTEKRTFTRAVAVVITDKRHPAHALTSNRQLRTAERSAPERR